MSSRGARAKGDDEQDRSMNADFCRGKRDGFRVLLSELRCASGGEMEARLQMRQRARRSE